MAPTSPKNLNTTNALITSYFQSTPSASGTKHARAPSADSITSQPSKKTTKMALTSENDDKDTSKDTEIPANTTTTPDLTPTPNPTATLTLLHKTGDIFTAPPHTVLIHACNTQGSWGAGIAFAFKTRYPAAFARYNAHCRVKHSAKNPVLVGTCLLIPPCEKSGTGRASHWIACLFTSKMYGKRKDGKDVILRNTDAAVRDLLRGVREVEEAGETVGVLSMCRINSGKFGVPWEESEGVLTSIVPNDGERGEVEVWMPED